LDTFDTGTPVEAGRGVKIEPVGISTATELVVAPTMVVVVIYTEREADADE